MRIPVKFYLISVGLLCSPILLATNFKCWTTTEGVYTCGNVIPPQYSPKGHDTFDEHGRKIKTIAPEKSKAEREILLKLERDQEIARMNAEKQKIKDRRLLDIYPSESAILRARDSKLASIDAGIKVAKNQLAFYDKSLQQAEKASERIYQRAEIPRAKKADKVEAEQLTKHLLYLTEQIERFKQNIADKQQDKLKIRKDFDVHIMKYREIKARIRQQTKAANN